MVRTGRPKAEQILTADECDQLGRRARHHKSSQAMALRSCVILTAGDGLANKDIGALVGCSQPTAQKWRNRFITSRLGKPATITTAEVADVIVALVEETLNKPTHWSRTKMTERSGLSRTTIGRIWHVFGSQPHRDGAFKLSNDPLFVEKVYDIVGLYLEPPESSVVLSSDEKSQVQALSQSQSAFPMMPGMPENRTHDYVRNITTSLFAAMNVDGGTVIASTHRKHRSIEFRKFLQKIDREVPEHLDVHVVYDNYSTPKHPIVKT